MLKAIRLFLHQLILQDVLQLEDQYVGRKLE